MSFWICRRGLSKHYEGRSQSFTSLANVRSLEDLAKPENPYNKKMRCCRRGYGGGFMAETESCDSLSRQMSERSMRGSCSSISVKRERGNMGITKRPPMAPHISTSTTTIHTQPPLFAWEKWIGLEQCKISHEIGKFLEEVPLATNLGIWMVGFYNQTHILRSCFKKKSVWMIVKYNNIKPNILTLGPNPNKFWFTWNIPWAVEIRKHSS